MNNNNNDKESILGMPKSDMMELLKKWVKASTDDEYLIIEEGEECPYQTWLVYNNAGCGKDMLSGLAYCPICGAPICPDCGNHRVSQLSRVTGYIGAVDGWNASKKQELTDRKKVSNFGMG